MGLKGDLTALDRAVAEMYELASPQTWRAIVKNVGEEAVSLVDQGFATEQAPDGAAWAPLKVRVGKILQDRGKLRASIHRKLFANEIWVGTKLFYGTFHQSGTKDGSRLPARPFLPEDGALPRRWDERLASIIMEELRRRAPRTI